MCCVCKRADDYDDNDGMKLLSCLVFQTNFLSYLHSCGGYVFRWCILNIVTILL